ncbi:MAG: nucleoside deaminase [Leptospiraceae bacterium]|nr:nucleoside deaminase [Leptospiraceae bacterium]
MFLVLEKFEKKVSEDFLAYLLKEYEISKEVPSITRVYSEEKLISEKRNEVESKKSKLYHSEILAIEDAKNSLKTKLLTNSILLTTLEPCIQCSGAIILSQIPRVIYFAEQTRFLGISSLSVEMIYRNNFFPKISFYEDEKISNLIKEFFKNKRNIKETI